MSYELLMGIMSYDLIISFKNEGSKKKKKKNLSDAIVKFILGSQKEKI